MSLRVAEGADRFGQQGAIERLARTLRRLPFGSAARQRLKRVYQLALAVRSQGKGLLRTLPEGESVRVWPEYESLSWNPDEYRAFRSAVVPGMVALDIGANLGAYSLLLAQWVAPSGSVFAFEPAPMVFEGLRRQIALNDLGDFVTPIQVAVGGSESTEALLVAPTSGESRLAATDDVGSATVRVPVTTVDGFCRVEHLAPDFIKIDVEGAELAVLQGARETIAARRGSLALFVEMHPSIWPSLGITKDAIVAELDLQGLTAVPLVPTDDIWTIEGMCVRLEARQS